MGGMRVMQVTDFRITDGQSVMRSRLVDQHIPSPSGKELAFTLTGSSRPDRNEVRANETRR